ncbi:serine/threonine-protein kinase [Promicromonospora sukumoe]|uniref:serine/threonine-protein kinase n=1 Tax=Promicromonospora sukumoe TaxID=88382 RepID=UPI0003789C8A|nr:serine/threonine-protein kinase [Promicromonospora sukumoe]
MPIAALSGEDPREVGPYVIEGRLGSGGMGSVYLGRPRTGRPVAVKLIHPALAGDAEFRTRFRREVAAARRVGGFWAAQVVDADPDAERPWMATAYVAGPSLEDAVGQEGALPLSVVRTLGATLAEGLGAIHDQGLVHRDLKPSNILLADDGPRVVDFGIAQERDATSLTHQGSIGTAPYMSPEQVRGLDVTAASDVFSLGSVLVFACTGRSPFGGGAAEDVARRVVRDEPDLAGVPSGLRGLVEACLAKEPADRPAPSDVVDRLASATGGGWELPAGVVAMIAERAAEVGGAEAGVVSVSSHDPAATERIETPGTNRVPVGTTPAGTTAADAVRVGTVGVSAGAPGSEDRPWWRTPAALWTGVGVAAVVVGVAGALSVTRGFGGGAGGGADLVPPPSSVGNMQLTVPDETHEITLEVTATGKDAGRIPVGMRYDGRLGPAGLADSFRSAEDVMEMDLDKMYTEIEVPWSKTITAQGTVDGANITLSAEAGWQNRAEMTLGDNDIAVSCRILIDGKPVVEEAGKVNVGCMLLPDELQAMMDEAKKDAADQSAEQQKKFEEQYQEQLDELPEPGTPEYDEWLEKLLGQATEGNG